MNLWDLAEKLNNIDKKTIDKFITNLKTALYNFPIIVEGFSMLPENVQIASKKWAEYGWAPSLPDETGIDLLNAINVPESLDLADELMLSKFENKRQKLIEKIQENIKSHNHNMITFNNAVSCFNNELYSACALSLFALIDSCFIKGQPNQIRTNKHKEEYEYRKTAGSAVKSVYDKEKADFLVIAKAVEFIVENLFIKGNNFSESVEKGLKRSFISHGMNNYNPNRTDCVKLFVLLYNIYLLFDTGVYHWGTDSLDK